MPSCMFCGRPIRRHRKFCRDECKWRARNKVRYAGSGESLIAFSRRVTIEYRDDMVAAVEYIKSKLSPIWRAELDSQN